MSLPGRLGLVVAAVILGAGVAVTSVYYYLQRSNQPRSGDLTLPGLTAPAEVSYDDWSIPTIFAESEADLFRAQGFIHAAERLWQLELFQRTARGRLSEIFGEAALDADRLLRTLDLWGAAERTLAGVAPREQELLKAYAAGVNARIESWRGPWPPEFVLLRIEPQEWTPTASLAIAKIMALDLSGWRTELRRADALAHLAPPLRDALDPGYPAWGPTIMQDGPGPEDGVRLRSPGPHGPPPEAFRPTAPPERGASASVGGPGGVDGRDARFRDPRGFVAGPAFRASNSWAIGGERTADGHPLLASDMHLALRAPSTWFVNALHARESDLHVAGVSIPGAPGVIAGFNRHLAWAFTNAMLDDADFLVESVSLDGTMYYTGESWQPFEVRETEIRVRGRADPVRHAVRSTVRGPVITDVLPAGGVTLSMLWIGLEPTDPAGAILGLNRARGSGELHRAAAAFRAPHQNLVYATTEGELGYRLVGAIPRRGDVDASVPLSFEWLPDGWPGFVPPDSMPRLRDPERGYIASANNLQAWNLFGVVGVDYPLPYRARRIEDRLAEAEAWGVTDMLALQRDTRSLWADRWIPRAAAAARRVGSIEVAERLAAWDRRVETGSREAPLFFIWLYRLRQLIAADDAGPGGHFPDLAYERILREGESPWVDDRRTPHAERLEELEEEAMRTALGEAAGRSWGEVHLERSSHPLGDASWLQRVFRFHIGPYPAPGGRHTVRPGDYARWNRLDSASWATPMLDDYGPSERFVAHLRPDDPVGHFLLPTGQAGNPLDEHYRDMAARWESGPLVEVSLDSMTQRARQRSWLRLEPAPEDGSR